MRKKGKKIWSFLIAAVIVIAGAVYGVDLTIGEAPEDSGSRVGTAAESSQQIPESGQQNTEDISAAKAAQGAAQTDPNQQPSGQDAQASSQKDQNAKNIQAARAGTLKFRNQNLLSEHFQKHGIEMGFSSEQDYLEAARLVVADSRSLHKLEAEDGDDVYYLESTNEFVIVSTDGYLRTYFYPNDGIDYFRRQ